MESFVYDSPNHLLKISEETYLEILYIEQNDKDNIGLLSHKLCNFAVMIAAAIEAHLNWYYYFNQKIDNEKERMNTKDKISKAPLIDDTKGGIKAIFEFRNQIVHPKYKPRNGFDQFQYKSNFALLSLGTAINTCSELLHACPMSLSGRIGLSHRQLELSNKAKILRLEDINGTKIDWVKAILADKVSLPIPSLIHVEKINELYEEQT